jgi:integrase
VLQQMTGGGQHGPDDLVFPAPLGGHRCAGGSGPGLRHTYASLLIAQGASVEAVQTQLGHATAGITVDTYGHLFPSELESLADRLEQVRTAALANRGPSADQRS